MDFSYSAPTEQPRLDHPERFLHFVVQRQDQPLPPGARRARLGGKSGLLAPASSGDYSAESYFGNHARFFWIERGVKYAATLHNFGRGTERLLAALVADLRRMDELRPPPRAEAPRGVKTISVPVHGPVSVAAGKGSVWVAGQGDLSESGPDASLVRIDPDSERVEGDRVRISRFQGAVGVALDGSMWVAQRGLRRQEALRWLDPKTGRLVGMVAARPELMAVAVAERSVWAVDFGGWLGDRKYRGGAVLRVDSETGRIVAKTPVGRAPSGIAIGEGGTWVTNNLDDTVSRIDARTNRVVRTIRVGDEPSGIAAGDGGVWVANDGEHTVSRIDPHTNEVVKTIAVGRRPRAVAVGEGGVWVTNSLDDTVSRIDPHSNRAAETIRVGAGPAGVAVGEGAVWVANTLEQTVSRIEP